MSQQTHLSNALETEAGTSGTPATVDIVIPTRNNVAELRRCLQAVSLQSRQDYTCYVCVDGSTDGTLEYLAAVGGNLPALQVVTHPGNSHRGLAATRNLPLELLSAPYVWYLDSDMIPDPTCMEEHLRLLAARSCVSQGQVVYANARDDVWAGYLDTRAYHRFADGSAIPFTWLSAANVVVEAELVRALRGFDSRFVGYGGEEFDFAFRLERLSPDPIINNKRASASTIESKTVDYAMAQLRQYGANNLRLLETLHPAMPRTFELGRLESGRLSDRAFVAAVNPVTDRIADFVVGIAPRRLRNWILNYKVISAVWGGYRSAPSER